MVDGRGRAFDEICNSWPIDDPSERLTVRSVKLYMYGALGSRGAALLDDYDDEPCILGLLLQDPDSFAEDVARAMECGMQGNTHAIGDRANQLVLDAYEAALRRAPDHSGRHRIEHPQLVAPEDFPRRAEQESSAPLQHTQHPA